MICREIPLASIQSQLDELQMRLMSATTEREKAYIEGARRAFLWMLEGLPISQFSTREFPWLN